MKNLIAVFSLVLLSSSAFAEDTGFDAIYGNYDNEYNSSQSQEYKEIGTGVAMMLPRSSIKYDSKTTSLIPAERLGNHVFSVGDKKKRICSSEESVDRLAVLTASCTAFLIGEDRVLTAGHCLDNAGLKNASIEMKCRNLSFVFGVTEFKEDTNGFLVYTKDKYDCSRIEKYKYEDGKLDFAVIKLDRKASPRHIFEFQNDENMMKGDAVAMISHPLGLPLTFNKKANITSAIDDLKLTANVDAFIGSSGAPVLDAKTKKVIGILTNGKSDFEDSNGNSCRLYKRYDNRFGDGILRINAILNNM